MLRSPDQELLLAQCSTALSEVIVRRLPLEVDVLARLLDLMLLLSYLVLPRWFVSSQVLDKLRLDDLLRQVACPVEVLGAYCAIVLVLLQVDRARPRCMALRHTVSSWPLLLHPGSLLLSTCSVCQHSFCICL